MASEGELIYLPKLADEDVDELSSRFRAQGFDGPKVASRWPQILRYHGESSSFRLMPRGLLLGPPGTFNRLGASLGLSLAHPSREWARTSWADNDYQLLTTTEEGLVYHSRGRHSPVRRRFLEELSRFGPVIAADELYMLAATAEACNTETVELFTARPQDFPDLAPPTRSAGGRFLHRVRLPLEMLLSSLRGDLEECLTGTCPVSTLADSTVILGGARIPNSAQRGLENAISTLENWVSDVSYFSSTRRDR